YSPSHKHFLFSNVPIFEQFFRLPENQHVQFVISSTWRNQYALSDLKHFFSPDFRERIIGITPTLTRIAWTGSREREIGVWRNEHNRLSEPWIALDDMPKFFEPECANVFYCQAQTGFTEKDYSALMAHISRIMR
ncbi:HAD domain-containing protein, partial [Kingella kingae]|uniref:HAD domain-containing protein n=1 Tax=Kingella kingae TaxID=504 RepID=UPI001E4A8766